MAILMSKNIKPSDVPVRKKRTLDLMVEEKPVRPVYILKSQRARDKLIKTCEKFIRSSMEYKDYMDFLKSHLNFNRCAVLSNVINGNGKKYSIEIHHTPFTLYDLVDIEITRRELMSEPIEVLQIAESIMEIHYDGLVGLIPLSKTQHELVHSFKCFIPLQHIYQDYQRYYELYEDYIEQAEHIKKKIDTIVQMSLQCDKIQSESVPTFTYLNVDGFDFPEVPEEWRETLAVTRAELAAIDEAELKKREKEAKESKKKQN